MLSDDRPEICQGFDELWEFGHQPIGVAQTKRVGVPIGNQLIGTAQMSSHGRHRF